MVNVSEIIAVNGIYISQLYANWYAVEVLVQREKNFFGIRYLYKSIAGAQNVLNRIKQGQTNIKLPDYRPVVHLVNQGKVL